MDPLVRTSAAAGRALAGLLLTLLLPPCARATVVHLAVANGNEGSGWMFLDRDGHCKVVTALHLVGSAAGGLSTPSVTDDHHHQWTPGSPILVLHPMDIAIVPVPSADNPLDCGTGRLSAIGAESRLSSMRGGVVEITDEDDAVEQLPVEHVASAMDAAGGEHFNVRFTASTDDVRKGLSGGIVDDADGLLGVVTNVIDLRRELEVVRVDAIRRLLDQASATQPATGIDAGLPSASGIAGNGPDPARGPQQSFAGSGSAWRARPLRRSITLFAYYPAPLRMTQVALSAAGPGSNAIVALDVSSQAGPADQEWVEGNYCAVTGGAAPTCRISPRTVVRVRIVMHTRNDDPIDVSGLSVR